MKAFSDLENCPTCILFKMQKTGHGNKDIRRDAQEVGQVISLDWGFMVQTSRNSNRVKKLSELNGEKLTG